MLNTIKLKSTGELVKVAEYMMNYCERNKATDTFDEEFKGHVTNWQKQHGLTADGIIGPATWKAICKDAPTCSTSKNKKSTYVCALQILIGGITVDGSYGPATKDAVSAYQSANNLGIDGICGQKTWKLLFEGGNSPEAADAGSESDTRSDGKVLNKCVHYIQWDSKWKNVKYSTHTSSQTIGNSGCGPSSMAMIMATFIDKKITPVEMCKLSVDNGFRTYNSGTAWGFYKFVFGKYNFEKFVQTKSVETLKAGLKDGALAVCSMNSNDNGFWTKGGHFITAIGYDDSGYIYANDPNKSSAPRKQKQEKFSQCLKQAFIFWSVKKSTEEPIGEQETKQEEKSNDDVRSENSGTEIIDISKWQGTIDFKTLSKNVALVVARAGCGSDKDIKFDEYAKAMVENKIPFGVYCYSYAETVEKAKDEAQKLISYSEKYNPLFYVMDAEESKINTKVIKAFAKKLRALEANKIGCYVSHNHYDDYNYDSVKQEFDFTWIPRYGNNNGTIEGSKKPNYKCDLWQYSSAGKIEGINGNVDLNTITGDGHDLKWFLAR